MREYLSKPENRTIIEADRRPKPVICVETGDYYPSQYTAKKATGFGNIQEASAREYYTSGGFHWRYAETVD